MTVLHPSQQIFKPLEQSQTSILILTPGNRILEPSSFDSKKNALDNPR